MFIRSLCIPHCFAPTAGNSEELVFNNLLMYIYIYIYIHASLSLSLFISLSLSIYIYIYIYYCLYVERERERDILRGRNSGNNEELVKYELKDMRETEEATLR